MNSTFNPAYMKRAIELAGEAQKKGEVPIGAVLILNEEIVGEGWNAPISKHDPTAHAEIIALRQAAHQLGNYRLVHTILYVTLEPCLMCRGALVHARVKKVFFGAYRARRADCAPFNPPLFESLNHEVEYVGGLGESDCSELLKNFFKAKRKGLF